MNLHARFATLRGFAAPAFTQSTRHLAEDCSPADLVILAQLLREELAHRTIREVAADLFPAFVLLAKIDLLIAHARLAGTLPVAPTP
jgi:hypothetical protein